MKAKIHPLVALKEKTQGEIISFKGYVGTEINDTTRLYTDLTCSSYYEIPNKAILYKEEDECKDCGSDGQVLIYVHEHTEILFIEKFRADKYNAFLHEKYSQIDVRNTLFPINPVSCYQRCVSKIKKTGKYFLKEQISASEVRYQLNKEGKQALRSCLENCGFRGRLLDVHFQNALDELNGVASLVGDDPMPEIPPFPFPIPSPFPWPFPFPPSPFPFNYKY
jgi:hypothetical protein